MPYKDVLKRRAAVAAYQAEHVEEIRVWKANYYAENREELRAQQKINRGTARHHFSQVKSRAKKRKLNFDLTLDTYVAIISDGICAYCSSPLPECGSGLDRKDSTLGYSVNNCVPCCRRCNEIRGHDNISHAHMFEVVKCLRALQS